MTTDLVAWNLERAAEVACKAGFLERILGSALHYEDDQEVAESRYMAGMHIASANAITTPRPHAEMASRYMADDSLKCWRS